MHISKSQFQDSPLLSADSYVTSIPHTSKSGMGGGGLNTSLKTPPVKSGTSNYA